MHKHIKIPESIIVDGEPYSLYAFVKDLTSNDKRFLRDFEVMKIGNEIAEAFNLEPGQEAKLPESHWERLRAVAFAPQFETPGYKPVVKERLMPYLQRIINEATDEITVKNFDKHSSVASISKNAG